MKMGWLGWAVVGSVAWIGIAVTLGVMIGRAIQLADRVELVGYCRCGHPAEAHEHYRPGTECSYCKDECDGFVRG